MNIDERIAALTMNLELMSRDREDDKKKIDAMFLFMDQLAKDAQRSRKDIDALFQLVEKDAENIRSLAHIAEIHEPRLTGIEPQ